MRSRRIVPNAGAASGATLAAPVRGPQDRAVSPEVKSACDRCCGLIKSAQAALVQRRCALQDHRRPLRTQAPPQPTVDAMATDSDGMSPSNTVALLSPGILRRTDPPCMVYHASSGLARRLTLLDPARPPRRRPRSAIVKCTYAWLIKGHARRARTRLTFMRPLRMRECGPRDARF